MDDSGRFRRVWSQVVLVATTVSLFAASGRLITVEGFESAQFDLFVNLGLSVQILGLLCLILLLRRIPAIEGYVFCGWAALLGVAIVVLYDSGGREWLLDFGASVLNVETSGILVSAFDTLSWLLASPGKLLMGLFAMEMGVPSTHTNPGSAVLWQQVVTPSIWLGLFFTLSAVRWMIKLLSRP